VKPKSVPAAVRYIGVTILFAGCGACSAKYLGGLRLPPALLLGIPFACVCAVVVFRRWRALIALPLIAAVYPVALAASGLASIGGHPDLSPCLGGAIGGFLLILCAVPCRDDLFARKFFLGGAVVGFVGSVAFNGASDVLYQQKAAFAIWQAAVGTYLYAIVQGLGREASKKKSVDLTILRLD